MYQYDTTDRRLVEARVAQFRDQVARWKAGALSDDEFRPLRLQNGLYVERHGPMLRVAIPYGQMNSIQLRKLAEISRRFDRGLGHFTTRQDIQYNWVQIEQVPDILAELATVEMHAIQTSGSCIRNVTTDPLAGVAADELIDVRPYAEILRQWSSFHPEFAYLPRKFKIAITSARGDRSISWLHDIGLHAVSSEDGELGFKVIVGGGMGRTPMIGSVIRDFLPWQHLLTYLEAILRVYNLHGRRDNLYKSRIKILVQALGAEAFTSQVEAQWARLKFGPATLTEAEVARVSAHFAPPAYEAPAASDLALSQKKAADKAFAAWLRRNVQAHKVAGYAAVTLSLKTPGAAPGDASAETMDAIADLADRYSFGLIRVSQEQNLVLTDVRRADLVALWGELKAAGLATASVGLLTDMIACPGGDYCGLANARSLPIAAAIQARFDQLDYLHDLGEIRLNISGCINACGHHHVGHIGVLGVDKNGEEWYQITVGGNPGPDAAIGEIIGRAVPAAAVPDAIARLLHVFTAEREGDERFIDTVRRIGIDPFKKSVYHQPAKAQSASQERKVVNG